MADPLTTKPTRLVLSVTQRYILGPPQASQNLKLLVSILFLINLLLPNWYSIYEGKAEDFWNPHVLTSACIGPGATQKLQK